jgi:hypothetical protein
LNSAAVVSGKRDTTSWVACSRFCAGMTLGWFDRYQNVQPGEGRQEAWKDVSLRPRDRK